MLLCAEKTKMIDIGIIALTDSDSIYAAAEKIQAVAGRLSLSGFAGTRLATVTAELSRLFNTSNSPAHVNVAVDQQKQPGELVLSFQGRGKLPVAQQAILKKFCDSLVSQKGRVVVRQKLAPESITLDCNTTEALKDIVERQTLVERLYSDLREKHVEAKKHVRRIEKKEKELSQSRKRLREMAVQIGLAEEQERKRLAVGLHDSVVQLLSAISVKTRVLDDMISPGEAKDLLQSIRKELNTAAQTLRTLTFELSPPILYELGLGAALEWLGEQLREEGIKVKFSVREDSPDLDETAKVLLFQCARELVANVRKHAHASHVALSQVVHDNSIVISIQDDGKSFDLKSVVDASGKNSSFGLLSVRERLQQVGGMLALVSKPGVGTTATISVPLSARVVSQPRKRTGRKV